HTMITKSGKVCKLQRSIYGLKQASRSWNIRFHETVISFGFERNSDESCVYKKVSGSAVVFLALYVDDILLIGNDIPTLTTVKMWLSKSFSMKDLGDASYALGIRIYMDRSRKLLGLSQSTYIDKVLARFSMSESKRGSLPMVQGTSLSKTQGASTTEEVERMRNVPYASAIGSIMYAMVSWVAAKVGPICFVCLQLVSLHIMESIMGNNCGGCDMDCGQGFLAKGEGEGEGNNVILDLWVWDIVRGIWAGYMAGCGSWFLALC
ncbi:unnamed protein product, partial [Cuscuta campestris]